MTDPTPSPIKIHRAPPAKQDPFMKIHEDHQRHRMRSGWIIGGSVAFAALALALMVVWGSQSEAKAEAEYWRGIEQRLAACEQEFGALTGYERTESVMRAVGICQEVLYTRVGLQSEFDRWEKRMEGYIKEVTHEARLPTENQPFVCAGALADMAYIPPGKFLMGKRVLEPGSEAELPRHEVEITRGFWMARTETTFAQWWFIGDRAYRVPAWGGRTVTYYNYPVCSVNWHNATQYCQLVNTREKSAGRLPEGYEYRLPTEAEWEYACRAGTQTYYPWNTDTFLPEGTSCANVWDRKAAWEVDEVRRPNYPPADGAILAWRAGYGRPNAFGLRDMIGNVNEWCYDWYNPNYRSLMNPKDPVQKIPVVVDFSKPGIYNTQSVRDATKVIRGGSWARQVKYCRSSARDYVLPGTEDISIGFRIVLAPIIPIDHLGPASQVVTLDTAPESEAPRRNLNPRKFKVEESFIP